MTYRPSFGELVAGIAAILLCYFMFLDWYGVTLVSHSNLLALLVLPPAPGKDAWEA